MVRRAENSYTNHGEYYMTSLKLMALFVFMPIVELYLLIRLGILIGAVPAVLIIVATGMIGAILARRQGFIAWLRIQYELQQNRFPAEQLVDGLIILVAAVLLITPGLLTDVAGFLALIPATRRPFRRWITRRLSSMQNQRSVRITKLF